MFVLTDAVEREINPYTTQYLSAPFVGPDNWHVHTFENTYSGRIPLTQATLLSDNTVFARLTLDLGPKPIAGLAHQMGIQTKLKPVPSIVLGVNAVSPLDLASAYATLADGGVAHDPTILSKVVFPGGDTEQASRPKGTRVVDAKVAAVVTRVLTANVQSGTGTAAALSGRPAAGKTGTTDSFADAWFAGFVPQLTTVTWVGYPTRERPMQGVHGIAGVTGGTLPAQIWHTYMTEALQGQPVEQFASPGARPFKRWCGRYQFARTWRDARKQSGCKHKQSHKKKKKKTKTKTGRKTTTARTTTARTTTMIQTVPATGARYDNRAAGDHDHATADHHGAVDDHRADDHGPDNDERASLIHRGARVSGLRAAATTGRLSGLLLPEHLRPPLVLVDEAGTHLRPTRPPRLRDPPLLRELLEHDRSQGVQPFVLRLHVASELTTLGLSLGHVVLDLEQAFPLAALLDGAGHLALPPPLPVLPRTSYFS